MNITQTHRIIGIVLLLPLLGWVLTATVFLIKPGYASAYEKLAVKTYPLENPITLQPNSEWLDYRYVKTVLGEHLIVRTADGAVHIDPHTLQHRDAPDAEAFRRLLLDAFSANPERYGNILELSNSSALTDTGIDISLNWQTLQLHQSGRDTEAIKMLYRIHYLQWTGHPAADKMLGITGILLLMLISALGARMSFGRPLPTVNEVQQQP